VCIIWIIKCLISLMQGVTMKILDTVLYIYVTAEVKYFLFSFMFVIYSNL